MHCYLCQSTEFSTRKGSVRDNPKLQILECKNCGLVTLSDTSHIYSGFYENSGMHGGDPMSMESWLAETEWDDQRRFDLLKTMLPNRRLLDFGCGAGGFLHRSKPLASEVVGVEPEARVREHWENQICIVPSIELAGGGYDLITAFHVIEHLIDPKCILTSLGNLLQPRGQIVIEVPSSQDALLTLYNCNAFQNFTYWSQHLFLFNASTLETLARQSGLKIVAIQHYQRYPLSNHLYWLSQGKPGGHQHWMFLDTLELKNAYTQALAAIGKTDTLIAYLEPAI